MVGVDHLEPCILGGEERPYNSGDGSLGLVMVNVCVFTSLFLSIEDIRASLQNEINNYLAEYFVTERFEGKKRNDDSSFISQTKSHIFTIFVHIFSSYISELLVECMLRMDKSQF